MADNQDRLYMDLGKKMIWVQDSPDELEGESYPQLQAAIARMSRGAPLFVNQLPRDDAEELSRLCDAVAAENGHAFRQRRAADPTATPKRGGFWRRSRG